MTGREFLERARGINNHIQRHLELHKEWVNLAEQVKGTPSEDVVDKYLKGYAKGLDDLCFIKHSAQLILVPALDEDEYKVMEYCFFDNLPEEFIGDIFDGDYQYAEDCYNSAVKKIEEIFAKK